MPSPSATARAPLADVQCASWRAVLAASGGVALLEAAWSWARGASPAWEYWLFCMGISVTIGMLCGIVGLTSRWPAALALATFAGVCVGETSSSWILGLGATATVFGVAWASGGDRPGASLGLSLSVVLFSTLVIWPRIAVMLGFSDDFASATTAETAMIGVLLLGLVLLDRWRARTVPRLPAVGGIIYALLFGVLIVEGGRKSAVVAPPVGLRVIAEPVTPAPPHIILLILDTVRADHLSIYGYERDTTPRLRSFLARSDRAKLYPSAHAPATWTLPAHASLFTGSLPSAHGIHEASAFDPDTRRPRTTELHAARTLAEELQARGYRTGFIFANAWMKHVRGMERGFDWYIHPLGQLRNPLLGEGMRGRWAPALFSKQGCGKSCNADVVNAHVLRFLASCESGPCFIVANYMEAHAPYCPSRGFSGRWAASTAPVSHGAPAITMDSPAVLREKRDRYDEEIAELDAALGTLVDALEARRILDRAWLVITSDHGEAFGEHGLTEHGTNLYAETTRIPLLVHPPAGEALPPMDHAVGLLDVATTLAAIAGGELLGGRDLRRADVPTAPVKIEFFGDPRKAAQHGDLAAQPGAAVIAGVHKLLVHGERQEIYDLSTDPAERTSLFHLEAGDLARLLPALQAPERNQGGSQLKEEELERLRALGYVE